jgi:hypothetical protein
MTTNLGKNSNEQSAFAANTQPPGSSTPTLDHSQISDPMQIAKAHAKNLSYIDQENSFTQVQSPI